MQYSIECVVAPGNHVGESPIWSPHDGRLYWVDSTGRRVGKPAIWRLDPQSSDCQSWSIDEDVGSMVLRANGGAILACKDKFCLFDFESGELEVVATVEHEDPRVRLNDGKCDRKGRFLVGGMDDLEELPIAGLYRLDADFTLTKIGDGIICSNGPCFSPDDRTFYLADTFAREMWAYDYDIETGKVSNRRMFADLADEDGVADGSTVDAEGYVWNAQLVAGELVRYAPDGSVDMRIGMPVRNITSVNFGGPKLDEIYVTSMARVDHTDRHSVFRVEDKPQFSAGALFRIKGLGITGLPEPRFAG